MLFNVSYVEWFGYLGSVIVAVSLTMSSIKKLRWYNFVGAAIFSIYGFAIGALPVGLLNLFIVIADIYYLYKMYMQKDAFKAIVVNNNDPYLHYFLDFYKQEIHEFFPLFDEAKLKDEYVNKNSFVFLLLRNAVVAGVFCGVKNNHILYLHVDFVSAQYRDLKPGEFIYQKNVAMLKEQGISQIICNTEHKKHQKYLYKMGYELQSAKSKTVFVKNI